MGHKRCATVIAILQLLEYISATFYRAQLCDVQTRMSNRCMTQVSRFESTLKCCVRCNSNSTCLEASLQVNTSTCYLHSQCSAANDCSIGDTGFKYFLKRLDKLLCVYGTWEEAMGKCNCTYPNVGTLCDRLAANCTEYSQNWPTKSADALVNMRPPPLTAKVFATCVRTQSALYTRVMRHLGELNFNRTWKEYTEGFFTNPPPYNMSHWVGLNAFRAFLGPTPRNIRINIKFIGASPVLLEHRYTGVVIGDNSTNYLLKYESHEVLSGTGEGYCLELSNMTSFSTYDSDNDNSTVNWAAMAGAGWRFPASNYTCNPLGFFYGRNTTPATDDGYVRFSGVSTDLIKSKLFQLEIIIEETYV